MSCGGTEQEIKDRTKKMEQKVKGNSDVVIKIKEEKTEEFEKKQQNKTYICYINCLNSVHLLQFCLK